MIEKFLENAALLAESFGIEPLLYGSLGLEYSTRKDLGAKDIDILIPERFLTEQWSEFKAALERRGYRLTDEREHTFQKEGLEFSYASIEELEGFAQIPLAEIRSERRGGIAFKLLSLRQYLKVYSASQKDGYRINVRKKKDEEKIKMIEQQLEIKELTLQGAPFERGLQYGAACFDEIRRSIDSYSYIFGKRGISWEQAKEQAKAFLPAISAVDGRYIEEMEGIAQGAAVDFLDILAINCRSELLYAPRAMKECTAFSLIPPATAGGKVFAGQSWDYIRSQREALVILRIPAEEGRPAILLFAEAGMIGGKGMNSAGLSLTLNALSTKESGTGLPLHIRMRRILEQDSLERGYQEAIKGGHPSPVNWILTHRCGKSIDLEVDCSGVDLLEPRAGALYHTNHFLGPKFGARSKPSSAGTFLRQQRMEELLQDREGLGLEEIKAILADHQNAPRSICRHTDPAAETDPMRQHATNHALIMDLSAGKAYFALGNPCENTYRILKVEEGK